jgi:hypothetical protein
VIAAPRCGQHRRGAGCARVFADRLRQRRRGVSRSSAMARGDIACAGGGPQFNVSNLIAVPGALLARGVAFDELPPVLRGCRRRRGACRRRRGGEPLAVIDYAHSPDALERRSRRCAKPPPRAAAWSACSAAAATATRASGRRWARSRARDRRPRGDHQRQPARRGSAAHHRGNRRRRWPGAARAWPTAHRRSRRDR